MQKLYISYNQLQQYGPIASIINKYISDMFRMKDSDTVTIAKKELKNNLNISDYQLKKYLNNNENFEIIEESKYSHTIKQLKPIEDPKSHYISIDLKELNVLGVKNAIILKTLVSLSNTVMGVPITKDVKKVYRTYDNLSRDTGISKATIYRSIDFLEKNEWIHIRKDGMRPNTYYISEALIDVLLQNEEYDDIEPNTIDFQISRKISRKTQQKKRNTRAEQVKYISRTGETHQQKKVHLSNNQNNNYNNNSSSNQETTTGLGGEAASRSQSNGDESLYNNINSTYDQLIIQDKNVGKTPSLKPICKPTVNSTIENLIHKHINKHYILNAADKKILSSSILPLDRLKLIIEYWDMYVHGYKKKSSDGLFSEWVHYPHELDEWQKNNTSLLTVINQVWSKINPWIDEIERKKGVC